MFATVDEPTGFVVTLKVAVVAPAATVTLAGTMAADLSLASVITTPPAGAGPLIVTVPVDPVPPWTLVGLKASEVRFTGAGSDRQRRRLGCTKHAHDRHAGITADRASCDRESGGRVAACHYHS